MAIVNLKGIARRLGYPRAAAVAFPRGATVGPPGQSELQRAVLSAALHVLETATPGEIRDIPLT